MTSTTFYVLRAKGAALGAGPYLGFGPNGIPELVPDLLGATHFADLNAAEEGAQSADAQLGKFEIEIRNVST